jgi:NodT family efflux transporter outer membrane factor (OMF) lipoprotein
MTRSLYMTGRAQGRARRALAAASAAAVLLCACADVSQKPYGRPDTPGKAAWSSQKDLPVAAGAMIAPDWWRQFQDPYLDQAVRANFDLKALAARIGVARAEIDEARAGALPSLDAGAGASFEKSTGQNFSKQFNLATQVNWDIDIWGATAKGVQAQSAEFKATEADWRAGYLTLVSDVATTYFQILQLDEQIAQQQQTLAKNRAILATLDAMMGQGLVPQTRVLQQRAEINRMSKDLIELGRLRALAGNALATLLGIPAGEFRVLPGTLQGRVRLPAVPEGLPSQLLKRRPDVVAAEYRVLAAYDVVGQAKLAQLPSISLTGRGRTSSLALGALMKSFTFGLMPSINFPVFDPGVKARLKTSEARTGVAEQAYRRVVMAAFEEVENTLVNLDAHRRQRVELQQQAEGLAVVAAQVDAQLKEGMVSQLDVFEAERSLLAAQLALLANQQQILADTVTLYKALGGGWPAADVRNDVGNDVGNERGAEGRLERNPERSRP